MVLQYIIIAGVTYLVAEFYKKYVTPDNKQQWENYIKLHHGEVGVIATLTGIFTGSPSLTSLGIGLTTHDRDDSQKWFTGDKMNQDINPYHSLKVSRKYRQKINYIPRPQFGYA